MTNKLHYVKIDDKSLYQLMISDLRYAFPRDNGLASGCCISIIEKYLPQMEESFRESTAKQLIEETLSALNCPEISGGRKHRAISKENQRLVYISDYEYQEKKTISEIYPFDSLMIDKEIVFEDEEDWVDLIKFLIPFVPKNYIPYNDHNDMYKSIKLEVENAL